MRAFWHGKKLDKNCAALPSWWHRRAASYCYSPQNLSLNPLMKQIVVKNPHNFVIQFILLQFHSARICAFSSSVNLSSRR